MAGRAHERPQLGVGFLLSQLGAHAAGEFRRRVEPLGITPAHVGLLLAIQAEPGRSQQALADTFRMPASRMVAFVDELESRGLVKRCRDERDRRVHLLQLTPGGDDILDRVAVVGAAAEQHLVGALSVGQAAELAALLRKIAAEQGLTPGVHPGYQWSRTETDPSPPAC